MAKFLPGRQKTGGKKPMNTNIAARDLPKVTTLAARGCREKDIARAFGLGEATWRNLKQEDPAVAAAFGAGRQVMHDSLIGKLYERAMAGDTSCLIFACKVLLGYKENEPLAELRPVINITLPAALPPEQFAALEGELAKAPKRLTQRLQRG